MDGAFAQLLKEHRLAAGLTQETLAERAGLGVRTIQGLEGGENQPLRGTLHRLAVVLNLSEEERARFLAVATPTPRRPSTAGADLARQPLSVPSHNLPVQLSSFVGRRREIATVTALLASTRLLTLLGTGGVGKSRLALHVAAGLVDRFPDGVWLVELAPLAEPDLVPGAVLAAMAIPQQLGRSALDSVLVAMRTRQLLLVLDNCEHLLEGCARLAEALLQTCPHVRILATSREAVAVTGETRWRVPSLSLPATDQHERLKPVADCEAVQLFLERAAAVQPSLSLTAANAPIVAGICTQLDGIPLALELAAARLSAMGVADLADRLDQRFRLLTGGSRGTLPRQQTLEATVTWSYDLLTPQEQMLFARLSVFARGWTVAAAEAIGAGGSIAPEEVLDLLSRLVDKSLVVPEVLDDGGTWYRLLETLRQYGWQRLTATDEMAAVQRRHAVYYLALSERADQELIGPRALYRFDELEREHDNLRAALNWCLAWREQVQRMDDISAVEIGLRMAGNLRWFWLFHDHHREELAWLDRALPRGSEAPIDVRARALLTAGILAGFINDLSRSQTLLAESVALWREGGERRQLPVALGTFGWTLWRNGEEEQAAQVLEESLALARVVGEPWLIAFALMQDIFRVANSAAIERAAERSRAWAAGVEALRLFRAVGDGVNGTILQAHLGQIALYEGDNERARAAFVGCLPTLGALGWRSAVAETLIRLAGAAHAQGDHEDAVSRYTESLALYRQLGDQWLPAVAWVRSRLGALALERSDLIAAERHVAESLVIAQDTRLDRFPPFSEAPLPDVLEVRATLAAVQDAPLRAMRLAGAAAALRAQLNQPLAASGQVMLERGLAPARLELSPEEQAQAWAEGQNMTPEEAVAVALQ